MADKRAKRGPLGIEQAQKNLAERRNEERADLGVIFDAAALTFAAGTWWSAQRNERRRLIVAGICPKCFGRLGRAKVKASLVQPVRVVLVCSFDRTHRFIDPRPQKR